MITIDIKGIEKAQSMLQGINNGVERAITSSVNKTLQKLKTIAKRKVTEEYAIKSSDIEETLSIQKANFQTLSGTLKSTSPRIALYKFLKGTDGQNIKVMIKKESGIKNVEGDPKNTGKAFLATMKNGHRGIFQRKKSENYPIKELKTLSIPQMLGHDSMQAFIESEGKNLLDENLNKEISRILRGYF